LTISRFNANIRTMSAEIPLSVTCSELHALRAGVAWFDRDLQLRLYDRILDEEGRLSSDEVYEAVEDVMKSFRNGVSNVRGYKEAAAEAYLTEDPGELRIFDERTGEWWDVRYNRSTTRFSNSTEQTHDESVSIFDSRGIGFSADRTWWTGSGDHFRYANIEYTSNPRVVQKGQLPVGYHWNTRFALDSVQPFLLEFLANK